MISSRRHRDGSATSVFPLHSLTAWLNLIRILLANDSLNSKAVKHQIPDTSAKAFPDESQVSIDPATSE